MLLLVRYAVFALVALAALAALGAMLVQRRVLNPFGRPARMLRDLTDPLVKPIERRVLRSGGNPQSAPLWLVGGALLAGILAVTAADWAFGEVVQLLAAVDGGARSIAWLIADWAFNILMFALIVRVLGSWIGVGQYNKWMRPFHLMTEWLLAPLRRILPPIGMMDFSPLVAWFLLSLLRRAVLSL
ncbi:MAG: YggT family protein [Gemmatimonadales bacterium]